MIDVGDIAPKFNLSGTNNERVDLDDATIAGRFILLLFSPSDVVAELARYAALAEALVTDGALVYAVVGGTPTAAVASTELSFPLLVDPGGTVSNAYGMNRSESTLVGVVLAPNHHVCGICDNVATLTKDVPAIVQSAHGQWRPRAVEAHPPVLTVPAIFGADDCKRLISTYRLQGNTFVEPGHGDKGITDDYKMRVPEYGRHDRIDHWILNAETNRLIDDRLQTRLFPEIHKAFQYRITRREHYRIGCYEGERGGDLNGHRDNTEPGVAHRRFAVSINLNTEAFSGGGIQFLEYGGQQYRPDSGAAIVFSSSLLHEILEVTEGRRYVLLAFLFGET